MGNKNVQAQAPKGAGKGTGGGGGGGGNSAQRSLMASTQKMKTTIDNLEKRRKLLESRSKQYTKEALDYKKSGNMTRAKMSLKRRQQVNGFVNRIDAQIFTLQEQQLNLEQASVTNDIIQARSGAVAVQKRLNKQLNIEQVEDLIADQEELNDDLEQVNDILAPPELDDAEIDAMFEGLDADDLEELAFEKPAGIELPDAPKGRVHILPDAPNKPVQIKQNEDEAALAALAAELI